MKPYYQDDFVILYKADFNDPLVREYLAAQYKFSALITDPVWPNMPEGMFNLTRGEIIMSWLNMTDFYQAYCKRLCVVLGTDSNPAPVFQGLPSDEKFIRQITLEYRLAKPRGRILNGNDVAYIYGSRRDLFDANHHTIPGRVLSDVNRGYRTKHPCPRPIEHFKFLCEWFGRKGMILDPFAGSGTTLAAAKELGLKVVGVEIEEKWCVDIVRRVKKTPPPLFYTPYKYLKKGPKKQKEVLELID